MDFGRPHRAEAGVVTDSKICLQEKEEYGNSVSNTSSSNNTGGGGGIGCCGGLSDIVGNNNQTATTKPLKEDPLDTMLINAANDASMTLFGTTHLQRNPSDHAKLRCYTDSRYYPERIVDRNLSISEGDLVVIYEAFDNLTFVYAKEGDVFYNRNGHFYHDDFIGKPFGSKIRSRNNGGLGFVYLLRPTSELWARSLPHRTQIVHELDASLVVFHLYLRPGMIVLESGTGSGAMSHAILRTIAPKGHLHTYDFNRVRVDKARDEFCRNKVDHLVTVHHRDVCAISTTTSNTTTTNIPQSQLEQQQQQSKTKNDSSSNRKSPTPGEVSSSNNNNNNTALTTTTTTTTTTKTTSGAGGFDVGGQIADAVFLDLPEPWLAVPHASYALKANGRICSYSPCIEQTQQFCLSLKENGFHSIKTIEARLKEYYVDEVELESPPKTRLPRVGTSSAIGGDGNDGFYYLDGDGHRTSETSDGGASSGIFATRPTTARLSSGRKRGSQPSGGDLANLSEDTGAEADNERSEAETEATDEKGGVCAPPSVAAATAPPAPTKRKKVCARPFSSMRGHTAYLTFATAGLVPRLHNPSTSVSTTTVEKQQQQQQQVVVNKTNTTTNATESVQTTTMVNGDDRPLQ